MSYGGSGNPDDETLALRVVYDASPAVKAATDDLRKLKETTTQLTEEQKENVKSTNEATAATTELGKEASALAAVMGTLDQKVEAVGAGFTEFYSQPIPATVQELKILATTVESTAGAGSGESGVGGFAGLTKNIFMAEKSFLALATGHGIARTGPMLEKLIGAAGGPAGVGFGIAGLAFLLETIGPKVQGFLQSWAESAGLAESAKLVKEIADDMERALKSAEAMEKTDTVMGKKTATAVTAAIEARGPGTIRQQIELGLTQTKPLEEYMTAADHELVMRFQAEQTDPQARAAAAMHGVPLVGQSQVDAVLKRARDKRAEEAKAWTGQLPTDKASRQGLRALAKAAPGIISPMFLDELAMAEPEAQIEVEQQKRAETAAGRELKTGWGQKRKDQIKRDKDWAHTEKVTAHVVDREEKEKAADRKKDDDLARETDAYAITLGNAEIAKATREHDKAVRAKEQHDKKYAREHTPQARRHAALEEQKEQVYGAVAGLNQQTGFARNVGQLEGVQRDTLANVRTGYDIASAVQKAIRDTELKISKDFERGMRRQYSGGNARGD